MLNTLDLLKKPFLMISIFGDKHGYDFVTMLILLVQNIFIVLEYNNYQGLYLKPIEFNSNLNPVLYRILIGLKQCEAVIDEFSARSTDHN